MKDLEKEGARLMPKLGDDGLVTGVVQHAVTGAVMMVAYMNEEALQKTISTGFAHFYSRSRQTLWKKGETSGNFLKIREILVDCDQDAFVIKAMPEGPACHTGQASCFYRRLVDGRLISVS